MTYCAMPNCEYYSDFDVYHDNGACVSLCESHLSKASRDHITQVVPQHGSDNVNVPIK